MADGLAQDRPLDLALDVDTIKHSLGQWKSDAHAAGHQARRLAIATAEAQLRTGHNVYVGQFLARTEFIEALESAASRCGADFVEVVLVVDQATLTQRLTDRAVEPERPEHLINATLVTQEDHPGLIRSIEDVLRIRPHAIAVDATGDLNQTVERVRRAIAAGL